MNLMKFARLGAIGAAAALLAAVTAAPARAQERAPSPPKAPEPPAASAPRTRTESNVTIIRTDEKGGSVTIELRNGEVVKAEVDGKPVPTDRVRVRRGEVRIMDDSGRELARVDLPEAPEPPTVYAFRGPEGFGNLENLRLFYSGGGQGAGAWGFGQSAAPPKVMLGVSLAEPDRSLRRHFGLGRGEATMLLGVYEGLPAAEAGLRSYDLVVEVNGKPAGPAELRRIINDAEPGETLELTVIQGGQRKQVTVELRAYDAEALEGAARRYREEMAAEQEELGFFDFNVIPPTPPTPPALPDQLGKDFQELRRELETKAKAHADEARRKAEELMREATARRREAGRRARETDEQLERLEERMERLERLLERLAEEKQPGRRGGD